MTRSSEYGQYLTMWSTGSPDLTPYELFLWSYIKDGVFVPLILSNIADVRETIISAVDDLQTIAT